jgi:hypothetical protein
MHAAFEESGGCDRRRFGRWIPTFGRVGDDSAQPKRNGATAMPFAAGADEWKRVAAGVTNASMIDARSTI